MTGEFKTKTFDGRHQNHKVRLTYRFDKNSIRIICSKPEIGADYLRKLIVSKKIGLVDSVIFSTRPNSKVVALMRGTGLDSFLRAGTSEETKKEAPIKKTFSAIAAEKETGS